MNTPRRRRKDLEAPNIRNHQPSQDEIARRAYKLYEQRGAEHGRDLDDWFQAERELRQRSPDALETAADAEGSYATV